MKELAGQEWSILMVTHDLDLVAAAADRIAYLEAGTVRYELEVRRA